MKISTKGRYALALMMYLAQNYHNGDYLAAANISNHLSISKTYLEQVLELLKRGQMVNSVKEGQDGYQLAQMPQNITVYDILSSVEQTLFESTEETVRKKAPEIDLAMHSAVFEVLDRTIKNTLQKITLTDLLINAEKHQEDQGLMFFV